MNQGWIAHDLMFCSPFLGAHHQVIQAQPLMGLGPTAAGLYNQQMAATAGNNTLAMQAQMQANAMQAQAQAQAALQPQAHVMSMQQVTVKEI